MSQNSLPLSTIVNVAVSVAAQPAAGPTFNQALIVGPSTVIPSVGNNSRLRLYFDVTAMVTDGFSPSSPEAIAATLYFSQLPAPYSLWVGRQDLTAIATVTLAVGGAGYVAGDTLSVVQGGASGGQVKVTAVSGGGAVTAVSLVAGGTGYSVASTLNTTGGSGTGAEFNITAIGETPLQALSACRAANPQWYCCLFVGTAVDADHVAMAQYIEAASPAATYFLTSGEAAILNNTASNLFAQLQAASLRRTFMVYSTTQGGVYPNNAYASAAIMGMAMGRNNGAVGSYFDVMFKAIAGVAYEPITQTQVNTICGTVDRSAIGLNGNVVLNYQNGSYIWLQNGTMASGVFFDEVLNLDMLASDMQQSGVALLTSVPALPMTNAGVTMMKNTLANACERAKQRGFIAPSGTWQGSTIGTGPAAIQAGDALANGYQLYAPPVAALSPTQKADRIMPPITVALIESGSGHSLSVSVLVQR